MEYPLFLVLNWERVLHWKLENLIFLGFFFVVVLFVPAVDFQCYDFYLMPLRFDFVKEFAFRSIFRNA